MQQKFHAKSKVMLSCFLSSIVTGLYKNGKTDKLMETLSNDFADIAVKYMDDLSETEHGS